MKNHSEKRQRRLERKQKKMAALLEVTKLNDKDRAIKGSIPKVTIETANGDLKRNDKIAFKIETWTPRRKRGCNLDSDNMKDGSVQNSEDSTNTETSEISKKPRLSGEEYLKLKQELKERKQKWRVTPKFRLKELGESARLSDTNERIPIFLRDVQHLLMYSLLGHYSPYSPNRWCQLEKFNKITHTVVFVVEGFSVYDYLSHESLFPNIVSKLEFRLEMVAPASYDGSLIEEIAMVPLTRTQCDKLVKQYGSLDVAIQSKGDLVKLLKSAFPLRSNVSDRGAEPTGNKTDFLPSTDKFSRTQLLLSPWQLIEENYPLPLRGILAEKYSDYVMTKDEYVEACSTSPMFALDCEMCRTTTGLLELTRISIVNEKMETIYDTLVKPDNEITDYLTRYSGITKSMLNGVETKLTDVQKKLRKLLPPDAILIGQSLNSDLHCLKMMHPYIIDTSVIFNLSGDRYRKTKLKILAHEFLNERIQSTNKMGHCSTEDSLTSMKLAQLKLANSIDYGDAVLAGQKNIEKTNRMIEVRKEEKEKNKIENGKYCFSIFKHVTKEEKTAAIVSSSDVMNDYSKYLKGSNLGIMDDENFDKNDQLRLVVAESNEQTVKRSCEIAMEHALTFSHVRIIGDDTINNDEETMTEYCKSLDKWFEKLWESTAVNGLVCVVLGGRTNASNGACFINIKKSSNPLTL